MVLRFLILFGVIIITACDNSTSQTTDTSANSKTSDISPNMIISEVNDSPSDIETTSISSEPLSVSLDKVNVFRAGKDKKLLNIKLKVEGRDVKNIEGYKFTDLFVNGQELERGRHTFVLEPLYESSIKGEERKNWFKPSKKARMREQYVRKRIKNNTFQVPTLITETDRATSNIDIKGELTLIVASEENRCAYRIKDFLAEGKLIDKLLEFNGGNIKFIKEPIYEVKQRNAGRESHAIKLFLEDTEQLLFDIYFEDATGKELKQSGKGYGRRRGEEKIYYKRASFSDIKPDKDWRVVVVYGHENCRVTIPFEFKNIDISL